MIWSKFEKFLLDFYGFEINPRNTRKLEAAIKRRMQKLHLDEKEQYQELINRGRGSKNAEIYELVSEIVNVESYFFRDRGQWEDLENTILPLLVNRSKNEQMTNIWSAGCACGEEAYTTAIIMNRSLPKAKWQLFATDINRSSIEKATEGLYTSWALKALTPGERAGYFKLEGEFWRVNDVLRNNIKFEQLNLITDEAPCSSCDLIICRNVFIYFSSAAKELVLKKFINRLANGGYLLTGQGEITTMRKLFPSLKEHLLKQSTLYQKISHG